ncbi:MAG: hypothetical protein K9M45_02670 [Kiritimatiellales bacterium]|nr:hypothetical protein [Kiritimatiellales bacterium]
MSRKRSLFVSALVVCRLFFPAVGSAVVFYSTGDTTYNITEPAGTLTNSGWQFQGTFGDYLGTPIAPHHFISASHLNGWAVFVGDTFIIDGTAYTTISNIVDAASDLTIWEVDGTFPRYAPLYSKTDEIGKDLVVFGRGWDRGATVVSNGETNGWKWGSNTKVLRWGENQVSGVDDYLISGDEKLLEAEFNYGAGTNECMLSGGDSGGGLFIKDGNSWKLAGINYGVDPFWFSYYSDGSNKFHATLFDYSFRPGSSEKVYYDKGNDDWDYYPGSSDKPGTFLPTRISSRYAWITNSIPDFDRDVDGLPDWWEIQYGGDATSMVANAHSDSDKYTNYEEWVADTNPTNDASFFEITEWVAPTNITFSSSSNRKYRVECREDLVSDAWQPEGDWFSGGGGETERVALGTTSNRFYRVEVKVR